MKFTKWLPLGAEKLLKIWLLVKKFFAKLKIVIYISLLIILNSKRCKWDDENQPSGCLGLNSICLCCFYLSLAATAASGAFVPAPSAQEIPVVTAPTPAPIHNQFPAENQPANQNAAPQVVVNPGANQNLRMNAQGGPIVEEDDEINRDWLDWTYSAATFSVFLSILYFYSSLSRFLMVMGATVVMYL